jgi:hypothetical protein
MEPYGTGILQEKSKKKAIRPLFTLPYENDPKLKGTV